MTRPADPARRLRTDVLAAAAVTLWPVVYFYPAVLGHISLVPFDGALQNLPLRVAAAGMIRAGSFPLWNPYIFGGMPLHGAAQAGVLFPLNWFFLFFRPFAAANLMTVSAYAAAGLGAYLYARRAGASAAGAALTGLLFGSSGAMIGRLSHINLVQTAALLPWVLWAVDGYAARGDRRWGAAVAALVALQVFAGHPQAFAYSILLASAYGLAHALPGGRERRRRYLSSLLLLSAGVSLAAAQILPTYELLRNSLRSSAPYEFFASFSLPPQFLATFFAPYLYGGGDGHLFGAQYLGPSFYTEYVGYVGLGGLALAALAVALWRDARTWFWLAAAFAAYALAVGQYWPFDAYRLVHHVPLLNLFRVPARHLVAVDFALAVLAGRGLTALAAQGDRARATRPALLAGGCLLLLTGLVVTLGRPAGLRLAGGARATFANAPELFVPVVAAAASALLLWLYARRAGKAALGALLICVALDVALFGHATGWRAASLGPESDVWREPAPLAFLRGREDARGGTWRLLTVQHPFDPASPVADARPAAGLKYWLQPDAYMMHGAENAAGYEAFGLARYSRLAGEMKVWGELTDPERTLRGPGRELDILNVRYLLAPAEGRAADGPKDAAARWKFLGEADMVRVYENTRALPRAWLAPEWAAVSAGTALGVIRAGRLPGGGAWDPLRTALVTGASHGTRNMPPPAAAAVAAAPAGEAVVTLHDPNRVELKVEAQAPAVLVVSENYYPGWRAYLDGRAVETLRVNYNLRGVAVPAGGHTVVFVYRPWSFYAGVLVTLLTAVLLAAWWRGLLPAGPAAGWLGRARSYLSSRKR